jgi:hypothetical protein
MELLALKRFPNQKSQDKVAKLTLIHVEAVEADAGKQCFLLF